MPTLTAGESSPVRILIGDVLTVTLSSGASCRAVEIDQTGLPIGVTVIVLSPTGLGPFNTVKCFDVQAVNGTVVLTSGRQDVSLLPTRVLAQVGAALVAPANTAENILATIIIPANMIGVNGSVRIWTLWSMTNNANVKTYRVRLGGISGTIFQQLAGVSLAQFSALCRIANRGSVSSQVGQDPAINGIGSSTVAITTSSVNTGIDSTIDITAQKATGGDTVTLESYSVEVVTDYN